MSDSLANKRDVIEALLCAAGDANEVSFNDAVMHVECGYRAARDAVDATDASMKMRYSDRLTEAAYMLIESSFVLRREWFGC